MCRYFLAAALLAALTGSAFAQRNSAWYVGGDFGAVIVEDIDFGIGGVTEEIDLNHDYGFDGSAFIGYDLGAFRIEAEVAYKAADLEHLTFAPFPEEPAGGSTNVFSFMANGVLDINALLNVGNYNGPSFFIGGGPGVAGINFDDLHSVAFPAVNFDGDDTAFAWQLIAGLRQPITDSIDVTLRYRFFDVPGLQIPTFAGTDEDATFRSHSILGGITFNFGAPPPPPPPPPPP